MGEHDRHSCSILICFDLDTVSLRVEGSGVVELQDDQGEGVSLRHLLVIVQRSNLMREQNIIQHQRYNSWKYAI